MNDFSHFPVINAGLNGLCTFLLLAGFIAIKNNKVQVHRICMGLALLTSTLFLISYLYYHAHVGSKPFPGVGTIRTVYFALLISHSILAALIVPLVLRTVYLALKGQFERHRAWARWTWPIWIYVSITGVIIYWMLYQS